MNGRDYYQILGVDKEASPKKVKEAYRTLAFQYHPDRNSENSSAVEKMKEINEAYAVLSDPNKRRDYDRMQENYGSYGYHRFRESYSDQDIFRGSDVNQIFEEMARAFGFRGFDEVFRESYQGYRTFEFQRPGFFARGYVFPGPGDRRDGQPDRLNLPQIFPGYLGKLVQYFLKKIFKIRIPERGRDWQDVICLNPHEVLEGKKIRYFHQKKSKELMITLPQGVRKGQQIRLKGMGAEGKEGGEAGDLYLRVEIKKPLLERVGDFLRGFINPNMR